MLKYAIVVIGYNRVDSINRLLNSIGHADYCGVSVDLFISIDNSGKHDVENAANSFIWNYGNKKVITHEKRLGLRNHILKCGEILDDYDALIVLEDDVIVSTDFFRFVKDVVPFYYDDDRIAGISLYSYHWNEFENCSFEPDSSKFDTYFMQIAQSWGQVWLKKQWKAFSSWYKENIDINIESDNVPVAVSNWSPASWKKYHMKYCIDTNKFFVYPYKAYSTCFSEVGQHSKRRDTFIQVRLDKISESGSTYPALTDKDAVFYDAFFERLSHESKNVCFDIYGSKPNSLGKRYLLTTKHLDYAIVKSFGLAMKPQECNYLNDVEGNEVFLYDTSINKKNKFKKSVAVFRYRFDLYDHSRELMLCIMDSQLGRIKKIFKGIFHRFQSR